MNEKKKKQKQKQKTKKKKRPKKRKKANSESTPNLDPPQEHRVGAHSQRPRGRVVQNSLREHLIQRGDAGFHATVCGLN